MLYCNLTGLVHGHDEVHDWYQQNVTHLDTAGPSISPGDMASPAGVATMTALEAGGPTPHATRTATGMTADTLVTDPFEWRRRTR